MSKVFESGHVRNLGSLQKLILLCTDIGPAYNPVTNNIKIAPLNQLYSSADATLTGVKNNLNAWQNAVNARKAAFEVLPALSTQLLGILRSTGAPQKTVDDFTSLVRKMRGQRSKLTKSDAGKNDNSNVQAIPDPNGPLPKDENAQKSSSQQSFDNMIDHFDKMIKLLATVPAYNPNELPLKVASLATQLASLKALHIAAVDAATKLLLARIARNKMFYASDTGLLDIARNVKSYIKGKFGASSQEYQKAAAIKFVRVVAKKKAK